MTKLTDEKIDEVIVKVWSMSSASQEPIVRQNTLEWARKELRQLFPQPLPDPKCPKCKGEGYVKEVMELHGMPHIMAEVCDCVKSQPLPDKELGEEIAKKLCEADGHIWGLTAVPFMHKKYLDRGKIALALLQPKIEAAKREGIKEMSETGDALLGDVYWRGKFSAGEIRQFFNQLKEKMQALSGKGGE